MILPLPVEKAADMAAAHARFVGCHHRYCGVQALSQDGPVYIAKFVKAHLMYSVYWDWGN